MSKQALVTIILTVLVFAAYQQWLVNGYSEVNANLLYMMDQVLGSCMSALNYGKY